MSAVNVSVIMAAYNGERYIEESIRSVLNQTYSALELIVIDDGSTDGTWEIIHALRRSDDRIVYAFQPNGRQARARNNGIQRSRGDLIAFCDQDDLWVRDKIERQVTALTSVKNVDVVFSDGYLFSERQTEDERTTFKTIVGVYEPSEMFRLLFHENRVPMLSALVRKEAIARVGPLNEKPSHQNCDDWDLWLRLAESGSRFLAMPDRLVRYRLHSQQASRDLNEMLKGELAVLEQFRDSPLLRSSEVKSELRRRYESLVDSLVQSGRPRDARQWARKWFQSDMSSRALWRVLATLVFPTHPDLGKATRQRISWLLEDPAVRARDYARRKFTRSRP